MNHRMPHRHLLLYPLLIGKAVINLLKMIDALLDVLKSHDFADFRSCFENYEGYLLPSGISKLLFYSLKYNQTNACHFLLSKEFNILYKDYLTVDDVGKNPVSLLHVAVHVNKNSDLINKLKLKGCC